MMGHVARPCHGSFSRRRSVLFAYPTGYETKTETLVVGGVVTVVRSLRDRMQFCDPDGVPFHSGTYFPDTPRGGMPSFRMVCEAVVDAWQKRRADPPPLTLAPPAW